MAQKKEEHIFCYAVWKQQHHNENWSGVSAVVTSTLSETEDACCSTNNAPMCKWNYFS